MITAKKAEIAAAEQQAANKTALITALNGYLSKLQGQLATLNSQLSAKQQESSSCPGCKRAWPGPTHS